MQLEAISPGPVSPVATSRFQAHLDCKCRVEEGIWLKVKIAKSMVKLSLALLIVRISQSESPSQPHGHLAVTIWAKCVVILTTSSKTDGQHPDVANRLARATPLTSLGLGFFSATWSSSRSFPVLSRSGCPDAMMWSLDAAVPLLRLHSWHSVSVGFPLGLSTSCRSKALKNIKRIQKIP